MVADLAESMRTEIDRLRALHAAEVRVLQHQVRALEHALAEATQVAADSRLPTAADIASARRGDDPAGAWHDHDATFEEKIAAKAFFRDDGNEEPSRKWLLGRR